jgi:hypothetical protein
MAESKSSMKRPCDDELAGSVFRILSEGITSPDLGLDLYSEVYITPFWDSRKDCVASNYHLRDMWRGLQRALELGISAERVRTVCHILWQQPCFPQKGSLTISENDSPAGMLTMAETI